MWKSPLTIEYLLNRFKNCPFSAMFFESSQNASACGKRVKCFLQVFREYNKHDVHISYLPLPHLYERLCQQVIFLYGGQIGFFRGDVKLLLDDIQALKPTIFPGVPRLLNRIYDKVWFFIWHILIINEVAPVHKGHQLE